MAFECHDSFIINFTANLLCTFVVDDGGDSVDVAYGRTDFSLDYVFTRGSATNGTFEDIVTYAVDNAAGTTAVPTGVTFSGAFGTAPAFNQAARAAQNGTYSGYIEIDEDTFTGTSLSITIQLGLDR